MSMCEGFIIVNYESWGGGGLGCLLRGAGWRTFFLFLFPTLPVHNTAHVHVPPLVDCCGSFAHKPWTPHSASDAQLPPPSVDDGGVVVVVESDGVRWPPPPPR